MSSSDYWRKREKAWLKECQEEEKDWNTEIESVYQTMEREIADEVSLFISRYAEGSDMTMAEAKEYLSKSDMKELAQKAKYYCKLAALDMQEGTDKRASEYFSKQANEEMARYNTTMRVSRLQMLQTQLRLKIAKAQGKVLGKIEEKLIKRAEDTYGRMAGILGNTVLNNIDRVQTIVKASFHGATFSKRIWGDHQSELIKIVETALRNCLVNGKGMAQFTRKLAKETGVAKNKAQRLLTTELARVQTQVQEDSMDAMDIDHYTFIASGDCCSHCKELDGKHFSREEGHEEGKLPPMHPNCRCSIAPYMEREEDDDFDEAAFDEWADTYDQHGLDWEEWKEQKQSARELRPMSNGMRKSNLYKLNSEEIEMVKREAVAIGIPAEILDFQNGNRTGYNELEGKISIKGDVLPDLNSNTNRDRLSVRAVLAHEYYGHCLNSPSEYDIGDWRDEFRASRDAALKAPNLTDEDKYRLIIDAYERKKEAGEFDGYDEEAKKILYG